MHRIHSVTLAMKEWRKRMETGGRLGFRFYFYFKFDGHGSICGGLVRSRDERC